MTTDVAKGALKQAKEWLAKVGCTYASRRTGLNRNGLRDIRDGRTMSPRWETVMKILDAMRDDGFA